MALYDKSAGYAEFYDVHHAGGQLRLDRRAVYDNWRTTWDVIVPGVFSYASEVSDLVTDLLFYDRDAGVGEFYALSAAADGGLRWELKRRRGEWRRSWDVILPGHFWAGASPGGTDLLLYERTSGDLEFHDTAVARRGDLSHRWTLLLRWEPGLDSIVTGHWLPVDRPGGRRSGFLAYRR